MQLLLLTFNLPKPVTRLHLISREGELVTPLNLELETWISTDVKDVYYMVLRMLGIRDLGGGLGNGVPESNFLQNIKFLSFQ